MYRDIAIEEYLKRAASDEPVPGGGSVSAIVAALGGSMAEMALNFTHGRKKYEAVQDVVHQELQILKELREKLLHYAEEDSRAYAELNVAYKLPKESEEQKAARKQAIQSGLKRALSVPHEIVNACFIATQHLSKIVDIANPNLISDVGVSAVLISAALKGANINVEVNLKYIEDDNFTSVIRKELDNCNSTCSELIDEIMVKVMEKISR